MVKNTLHDITWLLHNFTSNRFHYMFLKIYNISTRITHPLHVFCIVFLYFTFFLHFFTFFLHFDYMHCMTITCHANCFAMAWNSMLKFYRGYMLITCIYIFFTWQLHVRSAALLWRGKLLEIDAGPCFCCPQPERVWSIFMRNFAQDHPPGWLLSFFLCLDQNPHGMIEGAIQGGEEHWADDGMPWLPVWGMELADNQNTHWDMGRHIRSGDSYCSNRPYPRQSESRQNVGRPWGLSPLLFSSKTLSDTINHFSS